MAYIPSLRVGKLSVRKPMYPSEPGYVQQMRDTMKQLESIFNGFFNSVEGVLPETLLNSLQQTKLLAEAYTPKKSGALVNSSYLQVTDKGQQTRVELGFAKGGNPWYGVYVHENVNAYHVPPTRSKFLQAAVFEDMENIKSRIYQSLAFSGQSSGGY